MNPAKRKKLLRFKLHQQELSNKTDNKMVETKVEQVVLVKEEVKEEVNVIQDQQQSLDVSNMELGLKIIETTETTEVKKEKKKK